MGSRSVVIIRLGTLSVWANMTELPSHISELVQKAAEMQDQRVSPSLSAPFDFFLWLNHSGFDGFVERIAADIKSSEARKARSLKDQEHFLFAVKCILLNLLKVSRYDFPTVLAFSRRAEVYSAKDRYCNSMAAYRQFTAAYEGLLSLNYTTEVSKGYYDRKTGKGKLTRICATESLLKLFQEVLPSPDVFFDRHSGEEVIRLKDGEKKTINYTDNDFTQRARANLVIINKCLERHWYDLDMTADQFSELNAKMKERHLRDDTRMFGVDYNNRTLYRIFNNGDFKQGGRFYGGWWEQILSEYRKFITIDSKWTVETDFSSLHPHMLYALKGLDLSGDAYQIDGVYDRGMVKLAFAKLLNGENAPRKPEGYSEEIVGMPWLALIKAIKKKHDQIADYFSTGYGLKLMFHDSEVAERVLLNFSSRDIPCLPVHDSFIVHHAHGEELRSVMEAEYYREFGRAISIKEDNNRIILGDMRSGGDVEDNIEEYLSGSNPRDRRWIGWNTRKSELAAD